MGRVVGASVVAGAGIKFWYDVKDHVLNEVIDKIGAGLTDSIQWGCSFYGVGEATNAVCEAWKDRKQGHRADVFDYASRVGRSAPIAAPFISLATDGDFGLSILAPAAACIAGWGIKYAKNLLND
ncbi:MAG: hypothetical protein HY518_03780 [Candidatus Aenigmarchaeota archaeon]|nr:hypothetical protein [Candidatus Aenigmarchaeota archaeon]